MKHFEPLDQSTLQRKIPSRCSQLTILLNNVKQTLRRFYMDGNTISAVTPSEHAGFTTLEKLSLKTNQLT